MKERERKKVVSLVNTIIDANETAKQYNNNPAETAIYILIKLEQHGFSITKGNEEVDIMYSKIDWADIVAEVR